MTSLRPVRRPLSHALDDLLIADAMRPNGPSPGLPLTLKQRRERKRGVERAKAAAAAKAAGEAADETANNSQAQPDSGRAPPRRTSQPRAGNIRPKPATTPFAPVIVTDYPGLRAAIAARRRSLGLTQEVLNDLAGLQGGYVNKLEVGIRHFGDMSLGVVLSALKLELYVQPEGSVPQRARAPLDPEAVQELEDAMDAADSLAVALGRIGFRLRCAP